MTGKARRRRPTATSSFGVSSREGHDASAFYERFTAPELSTDDRVADGDARAVDRIVAGDARHMDAVADRSVALVVTSPPYFAGKEYETALGEGHVPATYAEYLSMLEDVFAECARTLEPGGRIAVNVANLGRRPFRSLAADVTWILQDRLRLLLRGEVVWQKARGAGGSCAWGSFRSPSNPVLRDLTERVVIASKGRFDRALTPRQRRSRGLPHEADIGRDEFMEATTDVWEIPAESATRVGHPAPFPVELPERLIRLYTYRGDLVLDPFAGSGTTAVAAVRTGRHFAGYDTDAGYVEAACARVAEERARLAADVDDADWLAGRSTARPGGDVDGEGAVAAARPGGDVDGDGAVAAARQALTACGFAHIEESGVRPAPGVDVDLAAVDTDGRRWLFEVAGASTTSRPGLRRSDVVWRTIAKAAVLRRADPGTSLGELVVLTPALPGPGPAATALAAVTGTGPDALVRAVLELGSPPDMAELAALAAGRAPADGATTSTSATVANPRT